jgi:nitrate reductase NapD
LNISGILVVVPIERMSGTTEALNALPGVEVHHTDPATGRIVVTQEAASVEAEVDGLRRIKALPHVILAEMVQHYIDGDPHDETGGPEKPGRGHGETSIFEE